MAASAGSALASMAAEADDVRDAAGLPTAAASPGADPVVRIAALGRRAREIDIRGLVAGEPHIAAWTVGDGACALHAVLGTPEAGGGRSGGLFCPDARQRIVASVPERAAEVSRLWGGSLRRALHEVVDAFWRDLALPAAREMRVRGHVDGCSGEARRAWEHLGPELRGDLEGFVGAQAFEAGVQEDLDRRLEDLAGSLFRVEREERVVRPLSLLLGYVAHGSADLLGAAPGSAVLEGAEGDTGALELLRECSALGGRTKYQALFAADAHAAAYRKSFFLNTAHNATEGRRSWMLSALSLLAGDLALEGHEADAELLRNLRETVAGRYACRGENPYPASCVPETAWSALREALLHSDYWLSVQELQLLLACVGCSVDVFGFGPGVTADGVLPLLQAEGKAAMRGLPTSARVVLDTTHDDGHGRGHFSRLWSEVEWGAHRVRLPEDVDESDDDTATTESSHSDSESSSSTPPRRVEEPTDRKTEPPATAASSSAAGPQPDEARAEASTDGFVPLRPKKKPFLPQRSSRSLRRWSWMPSATSATIATSSMWRRLRQQHREHRRTGTSSGSATCSGTCGATLCYLPTPTTPGRASRTCTVGCVCRRCIALLPGARGPTTCPWPRTGTWRSGSSSISGTGTPRRRCGRFSRTCKSCKSARPH